MDGRTEDFFPFGWSWSCAVQTGVLCSSIPGGARAAFGFGAPALSLDLSFLRAWGVEGEGERKSEKESFLGHQVTSPFFFFQKARPKARQPPPINVAAAAAEDRMAQLELVTKQKEKEEGGGRKKAQSIAMPAQKSRKKGFKCTERAPSVNFQRSQRSHSPPKKTKLRRGEIFSALSFFLPFFG